MFVDDIWCATRRGDLEKVREFIARDGIPLVGDDRDFDSQSLLTVACEAGHIEIVRLLLKEERHGLKPYSFAPFAFAALENGHLEVLRLLFESGLDYNVDCYSDHDPSLMAVAVDSQQKDALRLLAEYGADLEYAWWGPDSDEFGYDPSYGEEDEEFPMLELATRAGRSDLVEVFIESGMPLNGQSAESYLERVKENEVLRLDFEAKQEKTKNLQDFLPKLEHWRLDIGSPPWPNVDANRIDENGDNILFRLLHQKDGLNKIDKAFLRHLVPLTDLSVTDRQGNSAWQISEKRLEGRVTLYLLKQAEVTISPLKVCYLWSMEVVFLIFKVLKAIIYGIAMAMGVVLILPFIMVTLYLFQREESKKVYEAAIHQNESA